MGVREPIKVNIGWRGCLFIAFGTGTAFTLGLAFGNFLGRTLFG